MSEAHADVVRRRSTPAAFDLRRRLDELARGECSEEEFVRESFERRGAATESAWYVLSLLDQRYRLGQLSDDLFQSIKSRIALRELQSVDFGTTVELVPAPRPANPSSASAPAPRDPAIHDAELIEAQIELATDAPSESVATPAAVIGASIEDVSRLPAMTPAAPSPTQAPQVLAAGLVLRDRYR